MRIAHALLIVLLAGCSAGAKDPAPHIGCGSIPRSDVNAALAAYDRQIATLRGLVAVRGLDAIANTARASAALSRSASAHAAANVAALAGAAQPYALPDPGTVENAIRAAYAREAGAVRAQADSAHDAYARALDAQVAAQTSSLATALAHRVDDAYDARVQMYDERENDAYVARASAVADRQVQLRMKLAALANSPAGQRALQRQLDAIANSLAAGATADRTRDAAALAAYRRSLESAASHAYASDVTALRRKAAANLALRRRVTDAQQIAPSSLAIDFTQPLEAAMATGASSLRAVQASQSTTAAQTESDFTSSGNDIAQRLTSIAASDTANTVSVRTQLAQLQRSRAALAAAATTCASQEH